MNDVTYLSPVEAMAANDSRLFLPNNVCGTRDIVTTECLRPDEVDAYEKMPFSNSIKNIIQFYPLIRLNYLR